MIVLTNLETTLAELVAIPSVTHDITACHEVIAYVHKRLMKHGLHILSSKDESQPWLFASTQPTKTPQVLLAAHLDVVPGTQALYTLHQHGDKLIGRGAYDMKFAAACYLEFIDNNADKLHDLDIGLLFTTDEEIGGDSMVRIIKSGIRGDVVFLPDGGDDWHIEQRAKGFYGVKLEAHGKTAHGSRPWEGDNAVERILDVCHAIRTEFPFTTPEGTTISINGINGGHTVNQIADHASAIIDVRSFDKVDLSHFNTRLHELAAKARVEVLFTQTASPVVFDKEHPAVQPFLDAYRIALGEEPKYKDSYGATDARHFAPYNIPCILLEPHGGERHSPHEWINRSSLDQFYRLLETWLINQPATVVRSDSSQAV